MHMQPDPNNRNRPGGPDESRMDEQNERLTPAEGNDLPIDLDGDGFIGNTGSFMGGTSYLGSNYGPGWDTTEQTGAQNEGNFGAAGHRDDTELTDSSATDRDASLGDSNDDDRISSDDRVI